jgi:hypothetical protein
MLFKEITLVDSNQGNFFENTIACSKRMQSILALYWYCGLQTNPYLTHGLFYLQIAAFARI